MEDLEKLRELEKWLSPSEAGRELETSGQWVTHLARSGQIRAIKTSLGWLVDPEDVKEMAKLRKKRKRAEERERRRRKERQLQLA